MPLAEWQTALGTLIAAQAGRGHIPTSTQTEVSALHLTPDEQTWIGKLGESKGFKVTCEIQRWWRETRLREVARLTVAALGGEQSTAMFSAYLSSYFCASLFFVPEALRFLQFVAESATHPHLSSIAKFERALLLAKEAAQEEGLHRTTFSSLVYFAAPAEEVLGALLQNQPLPEVQSERFPVFVSSAIQHFWRPATPDDAELSIP